MGRVHIMRIGEYEADRVVFEWRSREKDLEEDLGKDGLIWWKKTKKVKTLGVEDWRESV